MRNVCLSLKFLKFVSDVPSAWLLPAAATSEKRIFQTFFFYEAGGCLLRGRGRARGCFMTVFAAGAVEAVVALEPIAFWRYVLIAEVLGAGAGAVVEVGAGLVSGVAVLLI